MRPVRIAACLLAAAARAQAAAPGAATLNVPLSVRQMGMGGVSLGGTDVLRAWSNPALLAERTARGELALNGASRFGATSTALGGGAGWRLTPDWTVGALVAMHASSFAELDAAGDEAGGTIDRGQTTGSLVTAVRFGWLRAGVAVKGLSDSLAGNSATAGAADLGVMAGWDGLSLGLAVRNLGGGLRAGADGVADGEGLPREIRAGASYRLEARRLAFAAEFVAGPPGDRRSGVGAEWRPVERIGFRAGVAGLGAERGMQATLGLSGALGGAWLDYAVATHPLGLTHNVSLSYAFGAPPEKRAPGNDAGSGTPVTAVPPPAKPSGVLLNVAVAELQGQNVSAGDAAVISDMLRNELVKSEAFNVVEKGNMDKLLAEQAFQQTGCTTDECAVKIGKMLNVQRMVVGSFGKLMDKYFISVRVVNVESGKIMYGDDANGRTVEEIQDGVRAVAKRLIKRIRG